MKKYPVLVLKALLLVYSIWFVFPCRAQIITTIAGSGRWHYAGDGGAATNALLSAPQSIAFDTAGNMYIAEYRNCVIRKVTPSGTISTIAGTGIGGYSGDGGPATGAMLVQPWGIAVDRSGTVFFTEFRGHRIRKVTPSGIISSVAGTGTSGSAGDGGPATAAILNFPTGIAVDTSGNIFFADKANNKIRKIDGYGVITTFSGSDTSGFTGDGAAYRHARFSGPSDVKIDLGGNFYIADNGNSRIRKIYVSGVIKTVAGGGSGGRGDGGPATDAVLNAAGNIAVDAAGNLYINCDNGYYNSLRKVDTLGIINTIAGNDTFGFSGDGGPSTAAQIGDAQGIAADRAGNICFADFGNDRIRNINSSGIITTIVGGGSAGSGDGGACSTAELEFPVGLARDKWGNLYFSDLYGYRIRKIDTLGIVTNFAGTGDYGYSGDGGPATAAKFSKVFAMAADTFGNVFIFDRNNFRIRKVDPTGIVSTIAGDGVRNYSGDGGAATAAEIADGMGLATDLAGNLYFSDDDDFSVRKISVSGIVTRYAGRRVLGFSGDGGPATAATMASPEGLSTDAAGNLYIVDNGSQRIRKVSASGIISTIAGNGTHGFSGDGGAATAAMIGSPFNCTADSAGNVYIADGDNGRIRKVSLSGRIITIAGNGSSGISGDGGPATNAGLYDALFGSPVWQMVVDKYGNLLFPNGAFIRKVSSCIPPVAPITGASLVCVGDTISLADTTVGGIWQSTNSTLATINAHGLVVGTTPGTDTIIYIKTLACGSNFVRHIVTVHARDTAPSISGPDSVCAAGGIALLVTTIPGGTWSSANTSLATVGVTGIITGVHQGTDTIFYRLAATCRTFLSSHPIIVKPVPDAGVVNGAASLCAGDTTLFSDTVASGSWSVSLPSIATIDPVGRVTARSGGATIISYSVTGACGTNVATRSFTVNTVPHTSSIVGATNVCIGGSRSYTISSGGSTGIWSSTNLGIASINSSGTLRGITAGVDTVRYLQSNACGSSYSSLAVTVQGPLTVGAVSGPSTICVGNIDTFFNATSGGNWHLSNAAASNSGNQVAGMHAGIDTLVYSVSNACGTVYSSRVLTIQNPIYPGHIVGTGNFCAGDSILLTDSVVGGLWRINNTLATVSNGWVKATGAAGGAVTISYSLDDACGASVATKEVLVNSRVTPFVTIHIVHDTTWYPGEIIAFDAEPTYGGSAPQFQWYLNGAPVAGATSNAWSYTTYYPESVYCVLVSNLDCITTNIDTSNTVSIQTVRLGVNTPGGENDIRVFPNPNSGSFEIEGHLSANTDETFSYTICNVLGEVIESRVGELVNGHVSQSVVLSPALPAGSYLLKIQTQGSYRVIGIVLVK